MSDYKLLKSTLKYQGKILAAYEEELQFPEGKVVSRDLIKQADAVAILAITPEKNVVLVKQYRDGARERLYEIPAGLIDAGEEPIVAAKRELLEETGCISHAMYKVCEFYASPGSLTSKTFLFMATKLEKISDQSLDEHEDVELSVMPLETFLDTNFYDAKTLVAMRYALEYSQRK